MNDEERKLLIKCAQGDENAFAELYRIYASLIYRFILTFVKSAEMADDLRQEVFIKLWEKRETLHEVQSAKAYLYKIAKNHTLNVLKRSANDNLLMGVIMNNYQLSNPVEDTLTTKEYLNFLNELIDKLTPQSRAVFILCRQQHKSYDEVAVILGISRNAVKKHMVKSMKIMSEAVKKDLNIPLGVVLIVMSNLQDF